MFGHFKSIGAHAGQVLSLTAKVLLALCLAAVGGVLLGVTGLVILLALGAPAIVLGGAWGGYTAGMALVESGVKRTVGGVAQARGHVRRIQGHVAAIRGQRAARKAEAADCPPVTEGVVVGGTLPAMGLMALVVPSLLSGCIFVHDASSCTDPVADRMAHAVKADLERADGEF